MRRVIIDDTLGTNPVAVGQEGGDEVWLINPNADLAEIVSGCNRILETLHDQPRRLTPPWSVVRRAIRPLCHHLHTCDD